LFGLEIPVKCHVEKLEGFSAHADRTELIEWIENFQDSPKNVFVVHGEEKSALGFAHLINKKFNWNVTVPSFQETYELFRGI
jgi:metallo-beta-lactamase family protein